MSDVSEVLEVVDDGDVALGADGGGAAGVDAGGDAPVVGLGADDLRLVLDGYEQRTFERFDALSSEVSSGFDAVGTALAEGTTPDDADDSPGMGDVSGDASPAPVVMVLDDSQWGDVRDVMQFLSTCVLFDLVISCVLVGVALWAVFSGGWRS